MNMARVGYQELRRRGALLCAALACVSSGMVFSVAQAQVSPNYQTGISMRGSQTAVELPEVHICAAVSVGFSGGQQDLQIEEIDQPKACRTQVKALNPRQISELRKEMIGPVD